MINNTWQTKHEDRRDDKEAVADRETDKEETDGAVRCQPWQPHYNPSVYFILIITCLAQQ